MEKPLIIEDNEHTRRVITYKPKFLTWVREDDKIEKFKDKNIYPILKILKNKAMTVRELESAYEKETDKQKSNKTIYRYLKDLEKSGLVIAHGQLVTTGKTATETIYGRTSLAFFIFHGEKNEYWSSDEADLVLKGISKLLSPIFGGKEANLKKLQDLIVNFHRIRDEELEKIATEVNDELTDLALEADLKEINYMLELAMLFAGLLKSPTIIEDIKKCFSY